MCEMSIQLLYVKISCSHWKYWTFVAVIASPHFRKPLMSIIGAFFVEMIVFGFAFKAKSKVIKVLHEVRLLGRPNKILFVFSNTR